ncbi:cell division protein FtsL [Cohnella cellulosilytica]|uniref:Cell division protein FtsL n=1 Tax=Cohnella cellulosilytica TaxID=986710 RepID=A0ABW2FAN2_9BACL
MAYYGNLALRPERVEEQKVKQQSPRIPSPPARSPRKRQLPIGEKLLYLLTIAAVAFVAGAIIFRYAQIYQINGQLQTVNKTYNQTTEQTKELQREVERLSDPGAIRKKALELGYVPVTADSIEASKNDRTPVTDKP